VIKEKKDITEKTIHSSLRSESKKSSVLSGGVEIMALGGLLFWKVL